MFCVKIFFLIFFSDSYDFIHIKNNNLTFCKKKYLKKSLASDKMQIIFNFIIDIIVNDTLIT